MKNTRVNNLATFLKISPKEILEFLHEKFPLEKFDINIKLNNEQVQNLIMKFGSAEMKKEVALENEVKVLSCLRNSKSTLLNLKSVFLNNLLRIPDFQRGFSWTAKELKELFNDIKELGDDSFHFTGILTLEPINDRTKFKLEREEELSGLINENFDIEFYEEIARPFFIIDGQQRLTSLIIFLTALDNKLKELGINSGAIEELDLKFLIQKSETDEVRLTYRFGYEKDTPSYEFLIKEILGIDLELTQPPTIYTKNLDFALNYFSKEFEHLEEKELSVFKKKVLNNLLFNVVVLDPEQLDISLVFETLNYRGKQLSLLEIFKNRLIFLLSRVFHDDNDKFHKYRDEIVQTWLHLYAWLAKSNSKSDDDKFLKDFWIVFFNHKNTVDKNTDDNTADDKKTSDSDKNVKISFNSFEQDFFERRFPITDPKNNIYINSCESIDVLLRRLREAVQAWHFIKYPELAENPNELFNSDLKVKNKLILLKTMAGKGDYYTPLLMALFMRENIHKELSELNELRSNVLKSFIRYRFVMFHINGKSSDTGRAKIFRLANEFLIGRNYTNIDMVMLNLNIIVEENHDVDHFHDYIHIRNQSNQQFSTWSGLGFSLWLYYNREKNFLEFNNLNYEINSWNSYKFFFAELSTNELFKSFKGKLKVNKEILENSLGNFFLSQKKNDKSEVAQYTSWTYEHIFNRGNEILDFLSLYFDVDLGKDSDRKQLLMNNVDP
jgi:uncharacterized protein with ParB-like and HNH nuclease domain